MNSASTAEPNTRADLSKTAAGALLLILYAKRVIARFAIARDYATPSIFIDEWQYIDMARDMNAGVVTSLGEYPINFPSMLFSMMLQPFVPTGSDGYLGDRYEDILLLMSLMMNLMIPLTYALGRLFLDRRRALLGALLTAMLPSLGYSANVMAENPFYPLTVLMMFAAVPAMTSTGKAWAWRLLLGVLIGVSFHLRTQGLNFSVVYFIAAVVYEIFSHRSLETPQRKWSKLILGIGSHWPAAAGFGVMILIRLIYAKHHFDAPLFSSEALMGLYSFADAEGVEHAPLTTIANIAIQLGLVIFMCGGVPFLAAMTGLISSTKLSNDYDRRILALASFVIAGLIITIISVQVRRRLTHMEWWFITGRYMAPLVPGLIVLWLARFSSIPSWIERRPWLSTVGGLMILGVLFRVGTLNRWTMDTELPSLSMLGLTGMNEAWTQWIGWTLWGVCAICFLGIPFAEKHKSAQIALLIVLFFAFNTGRHYLHAEGAVSLSNRYRKAAIKIVEDLPEESVVFLLLDRLEKEAMMQLGVEKAIRPIIIGPRTDFYVAPIVPSADGVIQLDAPANSWLLASSTWGIDLPPDLGYGFFRGYRIPDTGRIQLDANQVNEYLAAPEAFEPMVTITNDHEFRLKVFEIQPETEWKAGETNRVKLIVQNLSPYEIAPRVHHVAFGYHWSDPHRTGEFKAVVWDDGNHVRLTERLKPQEITSVMLDVTAPEEAGERWVLQIDTMEIIAQNRIWSGLGRGEVFEINVAP